MWFKTLFSSTFGVASLRAPNWTGGPEAASAVVEPPHLLQARLSDLQSIFHLFFSVRNSTFGLASLRAPSRTGGPEAASAVGRTFTQPCLRPLCSQTQSDTHQTHARHNPNTGQTQSQTHQNPRKTHIRHTKTHKNFFPAVKIPNHHPSHPRSTPFQSTNEQPMV